MINLTAATPTPAESPTTPDSPPEIIENVIPEVEQVEEHSETESIVELVIQSDPIVYNNNSGNNYLESETPVSNIKIPESHQMQINAYPGVASHGQIPIDIVKSFAPVSPQRHPAPVHQEMNSPTTNGSNDIYSDYIQDPYNLTLQIDPNYPASSKEISQNNTTSASTIFHSASYFGNDSTDFLINRP